MRDRKEQIQDRISGEGLARLLDSMGFQTKRAGREHKILCPFHDDNKPSMTVCTTKNPSGILKCFSCGAAHDVFSFTESVFGLGGFKETLEFLAGKLGLAAEVKGQRAKVEQREVIVRVPTATQMTSSEVYAVYKRLKDKREDLGTLGLEMGILPEALEMYGAFSVVCGKDKASGEYQPGRGWRAMIWPQRSEVGELVSLQFRSLEPREPGESAKRWSLDQSVPGDPKTQFKHTVSGLIGPQDFFDEPPGPDQFAIVQEGGTDHGAALSMLIEAFGTDWHQWPARVYGLPGVSSSHDLLVPEILGKMVVFMLDPDAAGRRVIFDRKSRVCELCGKVGRDEFCGQKDVKTGVPCHGRTLIDARGPVIPGLLSKMEACGITAMAAFPPAANGKKVDIRDLYRDGWKWDRLHSHIITTATKARRDRAA